MYKRNLPLSEEEQEEFDGVITLLESVLSPFEKDVLAAYLECDTAKDIVKKMKKYLHKTKYKIVAVDNALFRIRRKAQKLKEDGKLLDFPSFNV